jgi:hypothetical protein
MGLDRILTHVEVTAELTIRHAGRQQGKDFAFALSEADLPSWPLQRVIDLGMLGPLRQNNSLAICGCFDALNDLFPRYGFGDKAFGATASGVIHRFRVIGKAEYHDRSVTWVGT